MTQFRIIKKKPHDDNDFILLHPLVQGDAIYEFETLDEANSKLEQIKNLEIYKDIQLLVIEVTY